MALPEIVDWPPLLSPQRTMHRNAPCWCQSGLKWKDCHRDRQQMSPGNIRQALADRFKPTSTAVCLHPDAPRGCSGNAINSHTLQKGSALAAISEDQHVISGGVPAARRIIDNGGDIIPQKTGVNRASIFPGFCSSHDNSLFLPIESGKLPITRKSAFLFAYRTLAYELHAKQSALKNVTRFSALVDAGKSFEEQANIQIELHAGMSGMRLGEKDLIAWKSQLDAIYRSESWDRTHMIAIQFEGVLPFVAAFANQPEWDFSGRRLQYPFEKHPSQSSLTVTVAGGHTLALFAWFDRNAVGSRLAESFCNLNQDVRATALLRHCLAFSENIHMRPSWWSNLEKAQYEDALELIKVGMPFHDTPPDQALAGAGPLKLAPSASHTLMLS